jgi:hypothetical protein
MTALKFFFSPKNGENNYNNHSIGLGQWLVQRRTTQMCAPPVKFSFKYWFRQSELCFHFTDENLSLLGLKVVPLGAKF